jgi:hypothetical protein
LFVLNDSDLPEQMEEQGEGMKEESKAGRRR